MNKVSFSTLALTVLLASMPAPQAVQASTGIQRCERGDGSVIYTDQSCAAFKAHAVPMAGDVLRDGFRAQAQEGAMQDASGISGEVTSEGSTPARSIRVGCARSTTQLAMDLQESMMLGDVNRLAESFHWVGMSHRQSKPIMQRLERMTRRNLMDVRYFDATLGDDALYADADNRLTSNHGPSGVMQLMFDGHYADAVDLEVTHYSGCYFVRF